MIKYWCHVVLLNKHGGQGNDYISPINNQFNYLIRIFITVIHMFQEYYNCAMT